VGELHVDPGKGCVQIRFGETGAEAANVHAKWSRGTLDSHNAIVTTTDTACFVPSAAMCFSKPFGKQVGHQASPANDGNVAGRWLSCLLESAAQVSPLGVRRKPATPRV